MKFDAWPSPPPPAPGAGPAGSKARAERVIAVLGPTNTGKTHYAIERMLAHPSGIIGLPLRLLAREVYGRLIERAGTDQVALVTGEEKIKPKGARYWVATMEAMPRDLDVSFVALDEIQLCADLDRGHVFTDRLLNRRGRDETLVIGAMTMRRAVEQLLPGVTIVSRPRLSKLSFAGERKLSRLPHRSVIVAFSAEEVYAIAELIRRQRGGAAVVLGALSPRTRNAQVALYQNGDVDYLVATDAIGMGLNLDLDHVAFAGDRKFDGWHYRRLTPAEFGQIAGRAGRHLRDGTFGTTGRCPPFDEDLIEALEEHRFDPIPILQWRNSDLDFSTIEGLQSSLDRLPSEPGLTRAPLAEDVMVLDIAARDADVRRATKTRADVARLWDVCQVPDYRKVSPSAHAELALTLFGFTVRAGRIPDAWFAAQITALDRIEGDIDTLSTRIAQVRTLTYIANRPDWLIEPEHWQGVTRQLEDRLSDALHERLAQRFVDRRTSVLMRRLRENAMLEAEITAQGDVMVEGQHVGQLHGFRFTADPQAAGEAARALNAAALKALGGEIEARAERFSAAVDESFALANDGTLRWLGDPVAKIAPGDKLLAPRARILADEYLTGPALETVQRRLDLWLAQHVKKLLGPIMEFETGEGLEGIARGIAYQIAEALGVLERTKVAEEMKSLDQTARATLRKLGVRFGAYHIYLPALVKPAPRALAAQLWALRHGGVEVVKGLEEVPHLAASGRTSFPADQTIPKALYRAAGFRICGTRAVRVDILERLADLIRPAIAYRPGTTPGAPPPGAADRDGFVTTVAMTSLAGCSGEDFASILRSLGYVLDRRPGPAITVPLLPAAAVEPLVPIVAAAPAVSEAATPAAPAAEATSAEDDSAEGTPQTENAAGTPQTENAAQERATAERPAAAAPDAGSAPTDDLQEAPAEAEAAIVVAIASEVLAEAAEPADPVASPEPGETVAEDHHAVVASDAAAPVEAATPVEGEAGAPVAAATASAVDAPVAPDADAAQGEAAEQGAPESAAGAEPAPEPVPPPEPVLIDVWRPHRTNHHAQRRPDHGRQRQGHQQRPPIQAAPAIEAASDAVVASAGEGSAERHSPEQRSGEPRGDRRGPPRQGHDRNRGERRPGAGAGGPPGAAGAPQQGRGPNRPRPEPVAASAAERAPAPDRGAEGGGPQRNSGKGRPDPRREQRGERAEGGRRDGGRPQTFSSERPRERERQPDPNSPFAKLLALKFELERKKES